MIPQFKIAELENLWTKEGVRRNVKEKSIVENKELNQALLSVQSSLPNAHNG